MARYAVSNLLAGSQQVLSTTSKSQVSLTSPATVRRAWIDELIVGADAAAVSTDCQIRWDWKVQTATGTSTTVTPNPTPDGADAAALTLATANSTAEPTYTAASSLMAFDTNQRQSQRVAFPDYRLTPLIIAATSAKGIVATALSTNYNGVVVVQEYFVE
jgi:hypothetical protein